MTTKLFQPRPEVIDPRKFVYTISPERVTERGTPEHDVVWFFENTYPSEDIRYLLFKLSTAVGKEQNIITEIIGGYGTGKSHILALVYHFFNNPNYAKKWLKRWVEFFPAFKEVKAPSVEIKPLIFSTKVYGARYRYLWEAIFSKEVIGTQADQILNLIKSKTVEGRSPDKHIIAEVFKIFSEGKYVLILLDELDAWVGELEQARGANIFFLEKLAEVFAGGSVKGALIFSVRGVDKELREAIERSPVAIFSPGEKADRATIIKFRLFEEPKETIKKQIKELAKEYVKTYKEAYRRFEKDEGLRLRLDPIDWRILERRMIELYPLHPVFVDTLVRKYDALAEESKEGIRGPLMIFIDVINEIKDLVDLFTVCDVSYRLLFKRLRDEEVYARVEEDLKRFNEMEVSERPLFYQRLLNLVYLYSLKEIGIKIAGASGTDIILSATKPDIRIYDLIEGIKALVPNSLYVYFEGGYLRVKGEKKVEVEIYDLAKKIIDERVFSRIGEIIVSM